MNRLWKLVGSSSAGENEFSLLMILQVARCVRMQLYRITLSHLYRKLLVTRFHSTVSVLRPTALTSLWLKKKRRAAREYLAHVHNRSVWQGGPSRRAAATADAFFLLPVRRPSVSLPDLCSAAVVLIWRGRKERGEVGIGLNLWQSQSRFRSAGKMWLLCLHHASAERLDVIRQLWPSGRLETNAAVCLLESLFTVLVFILLPFGIDSAGHLIQIHMLLLETGQEMPQNLISGIVFPSRQRAHTHFYLF